MSQAASAFDPASFQKIWMDTIAKMGVSLPPAAAASPASAPSAEAMNQWAKQMQKAWLDAMSKWCDEYMRSPQFLEQMKSSMEQTLAFRRQMEDFIGKASNQAFSGSFMPSSADLLKALKDMETRLAARVDDLSDRVETLESGRKAPAAASSARKPASRRSAKSSRKSPRRK